MRRVLKKIALIFAALIFFLVAAAVIIPLVVDVDKYRPQIMQAVNERMNGKLELGKLSLSLWGKVRVEVAGLTLKDMKGRPVLSVQDAFFHMPFSSVLSGSPELTFRMQKPEVRLSKDATGKWNVLSLMKETSTTPPATQKPTSPSMALPALALRARLGVELRNAFVSTRDEVSGVSSTLRDLNLALRDISLSRPTSLELWADLNTEMVQKTGQKVSVRGPVRINGESQVLLADQKIQGFALKLNVNLDDLEIQMPGLFEKKKGVVAQAQGRVRTTLQEVTIEQFDVKFFNAQVKASGTVNPSEVHVTFKSNEIALQPWSQLVPMLKDYQLGGVALFDGAMDGPVEKLNYRADLVARGVTAKAPGLKVSPQIDAAVKVSTDQIENFSVIMKAPGNHLAAHGKLVSFTQPRLEMMVNSNGLDFDQLLVLPPLKKTAAAPGGKAISAQASPAASAVVAKQDYDALLAPLQANAMLKSTSAEVGVDIKALKVYDVRMGDIKARLTFRDLVAAVENASFSLWGGGVSAKGAAFLKTKVPTYRFSAEVQKLDIQQAVASQFAVFKNTLLGKASMKVSGSGSSFNPDAAKVSLNIKGDMKVEKATFATVDVSKMAMEGVNKSMAKIAERIPGAKGKKLPSSVARECRYDVISSDFSMASGKFSASNFVAKAEPNQGVDLKGEARVGIIDGSVDASLQVIDTYNLTHARDLGVNEAGMEIPHLLAEGNGPVRFPVHVGCTLVAPCYSYTEVPEFLLKVALSNVSRGVKGKAKAEFDKAKAELRKKAEEATKQKAKDLTKQAAPAVQNAVKGLGKKLFGR